MQHVVHPFRRVGGDRWIRQIPFDELHSPERFEIATFAGDQTIDYAHPLAAAQQLLREMRSDKSRAAGDEIRGHYWSDPLGRRGINFTAFAEYTFRSTSSGNPMPYSFQKAW